MSEWMVTYSDGSSETFSDDLTIELVCEYADSTKNIIKIEKVFTNIVDTLTVC